MDSRVQRIHLPLLPRIKAMGFDGVELARFSFHDCPAAPIRRAIESNGLHGTFCTALTGQMSLANENSAQTLTFLKMLSSGQPKSDPK